MLKVLSEIEDPYLSDRTRDTGELRLPSAEQQPSPSAHGSALVNGRAPAPPTGSQETVVMTKDFEPGRPLRPFPCKPYEVFLHQIPQVGYPYRQGWLPVLGEVKISGNGVAVWSLADPDASGGRSQVAVRQSSVSHRPQRHVSAPKSCSPET
jgi:hypothetical protein